MNVKNYVFFNIPQSLMWVKTQNLWDFNQETNSASVERLHFRNTKIRWRYVSQIGKKEIIPNLTVKELRSEVTADRFRGQSVPDGAHHDPAGTRMSKTTDFVFPAVEMMSCLFDGVKISFHFLLLTFCRRVKVKDRRMKWPVFSTESGNWFNL